MDYLFSFALLVHVCSALGIIGLVLVQHGKGADMGAAFGGGASGSLFGATGSANFLSRTTAVLAVVFFVTSLSLGYMVSQSNKTAGSVLQDAVKLQNAPEQAPQETVPGKEPESKDKESVPK